MKPSRMLLPFSYLYGVIVAIRNAFFEKKIFRTDAVSIPVISVGNMTTGGTGKTPIVELIASMLHDRDVCTAIVSRGYKRRSTGLLVVSDGAAVLAPADRAGDEPHQLAVNLPGVIVIVDERRARGARYAHAALHAGMVILDDGFQHRRLERSCDIVVIDAEQDLFTMPMLPAGHRREPLSSLARADAFIITKCGDSDAVLTIQKRLHGFNAHAPVFTSVYAPHALIDCSTGAVMACAEAAGRTVVGFCGIGRPESFERSCASIGVAMASFHAFGDHHAYDAADFAMLERSMRSTGADGFLTTEKDAHRIAGRFTPDVPVYYLKMRARVNETDAFGALIDTVCGRLPGAAVRS